MIIYRIYSITRCTCGSEHYCNKTIKIQECEWYTSERRHIFMYTSLHTHALFAIMLVNIFTFSPKAIIHYPT